MAVGVPTWFGLVSGRTWLDAAEGELLVQDRPLATWDEVITAGVRRGVESEADELGASMRAMKLGDGGLDSVLRLVDDHEPGREVEQPGHVGLRVGRDAVQAVPDHDELPGAGGVIPVHGSSHPL